MRRWYPVLCLGSIVLTGSCGVEQVVQDLFTVRWNFINNSAEEVRFNGVIDEENFTASANVAAHGSHSEDATRPLEENALVVTMRVFSTGGSEKAQKVTGFGVAAGSTTTVTAIWDGTTLTLSTACQDAPPIAVAISEPAASCQAPVTTWTLDPVVGAVSGTWSDNFSTGTGSLAISFPATVQSGQTVTLSATFTESVTYKPGFTGTEGIFLSVQGGVGFSATPNPVTIGTATAANPTVGGSVTASGSWTVPENGPGGKLTFNLQGGPSTTHGVGWGLAPQVSYSKVP